MYQLEITRQTQQITTAQASSTISACQIRFIKKCYQQQTIKITDRISFDILLYYDMGINFMTIVHGK